MSRDPVTPLDGNRGQLFRRALSEKVGSFSDKIEERDSEAGGVRGTGDPGRRGNGEPEEREIGGGGSVGAGDPGLVAQEGEKIGFGDALCEGGTAEAAGGVGGGPPPPRPPGAHPPLVCPVSPDHTHPLPR